MGQFIQIRVDSKVATVTINNPPLNILTAEVMKEFKAALEELRERRDVKCLVLTGVGQVFAAGADIKQIAQIRSGDDGRKAAGGGQELFQEVERLGKPVIAAINGVCLGGGMELAMACHIRLCSDRAKLGQPEINLGIIPGFGGSQRLSRLVGRAKALEWILTGDNIPPQDAKEAGLVNLVAAESELLRHAQELAEKIAQKPSVALAQALDVVLKGLDQASMDSALKVELYCFAKCCESADMKEGIKAFLEKRQPQFTDQ